MKAQTIMLLITSLIACNQHTVKKSLNLSREITTIQFSTSKKPYETKEEVGGEQINETIILAKTNESYLIVIKANNNNLNFNINGESIQVKILDDNPLKRKVTTSAQTKIELSFTAHPDSSMYDLKVTKL